MLLIKNGRLPAKDGVFDLLVKHGRVEEISRSIPPHGGAVIIDADNLIISPGFVDMHVHFRDPGYEHKEDIYTGALSAAAGGVTCCACMPNTNPTADNGEVLSYITNKAKNALVSVLPYGAVTVGQKGETLTDFKALKDAGAVALSDDGNPIQSANVMRKALMLAREHDMLISSHCEDGEMVLNYAVNEGCVSKKLGIPGRPAIAEELMAARDAMLAAETGARVHIAHVSTAATVEIIRRAKDNGVNITAETCPQYFSLTEDAVLQKGTLARVNPPLRTQKDVDAIIKALADGTIDVIATDHAPHAKSDKDCSLTDAMSGMIGLETSLALTLTHLYHTGHLSINRIVELMSLNPARILGVGGGFIEKGAAADLVLFDTDCQWRADPNQFKSKARNTPFGDMVLNGRVKYTIKNGEIVYSD